jgi:hypothetical protein
MALDLDDDLKFHRMNWKVQHIGWGVIALIIIAALCGATGSGPLGDATAGSHGFRIEYGRIMRRSAPSEVVVTIERQLLRNSTAHVWITQRVMDGCKPKTIMPTPRRVTARREATEFELEVTPNTDSSIVRFVCEPDRVGTYDGVIGIRGGPSIPVRAYVLP